MNLNKRIFFTCLATAGLCQAASFAVDQQPLLVLATALPIWGMLLARRPAFFWLAHISLGGFAALSAAGLLIKAPVLPLILASSAALAAWDLLLESHLDVTNGEALGNRNYEKLHLKSLGLAVGSGLFMASVGALIHWQAPFSVTLVLLILALYCLDRALYNVIR